MILTTSEISVTAGNTGVFTYTPEVSLGRFTGLSISPLNSDNTAVTTGYSAYQLHLYLVSVYQKLLGVSFNHAKTGDYVFNMTPMDVTPLNPIKITITNKTANTVKYNIQIIGDKE